MASATRYLANFPGGETQKLNRELLSREGPLVRREAVRNFVPADIEDLKTNDFPVVR